MDGLSIEMFKPSPRVVAPDTGGEPLLNAARNLS
jgi:hypothetical protein